MNKEIKHTPLPWFVCGGEFRDQVCSQQIYDEVYAETKDDNDACGESLIFETAGNFENAAFILKACNNHYRLVEMLEKATNQLRSVTVDEPNTYDWYKSEAIYKECEQLLKEVKG